MNEEAIERGRKTSRTRAGEMQRGGAKGGPEDAGTASDQGHVC